MPRGEALLIVGATIDEGTIPLPEDNRGSSSKRASSWLIN